MVMKIGELANAAGVPVATVRYYERRGLMPEPPRTGSGYRQYDAPAVDRLRFVKRAQELGFTLEEIEELLALRVEPDAGCGDVERRATRALARIEAKLNDLDRMRAVLSRLVEDCRSRRATDECPILESLEMGGCDDDDG